jgi:hypothetical protein
MGRHLGKNTRQVGETCWLRFQGRKMANVVSASQVCTVGKLVLCMMEFKSTTRYNMQTKFWQTLAC